MRFRKHIRGLRADESGATAIEYALICGIMGLALIAVAGTGGALEVLWDRLAQVVDAVNNPSGVVEDDGG